MRDRWELRRIPLRFQLGDQRLLTVERDLLVRQVSLKEILSGARIEIPNYSELPDLCQGCLVRSGPSTTDEEQISRCDRYIRYVSEEYYRYYVTLEGTFDDYVNSNFSRKSRSTLRRKIRRFRERAGGTIQWKVYRTPQELEHFHELARTVSVKSYQERLFDSGLPSNANFKKELRTLAECDAARGFLLFDGKKPIAYLYSPASEEVLIYAYLGYLPEYRNWSGGSVLHWLALEELFNEQRFELFDFTEGEGEHKRRFANGHVRCANIYYFTEGLRNEFLIWSHKFTNSASESIGAFLETTEMKAHVRRLLRFGIGGAKV